MDRRDFLKRLMMTPALLPFIKPPKEEPEPEDQVAQLLTPASEKPVRPQTQNWGQFSGSSMIFFGPMPAASYMAYGPAFTHFATGDDYDPEPPPAWDYSYQAGSKKEREARIRDRIEWMKENRPKLPG